MSVLQNDILQSDVKTIRIPEKKRKKEEYKRNVKYKIADKIRCIKFLTRLSKLHMELNIGNIENILWKMV